MKVATTTVRILISLIPLLGANAFARDIKITRLVENYPIEVNGADLKMTKSKIGTENGHPSLLGSEATFEFRGTYTGECVDEVETVIESASIDDNGDEVANILFSRVFAEKSGPVLNQPACVRQDSGRLAFPFTVKYWGGEDGATQASYVYRFLNQLGNPAFTVRISVDIQKGWSFEKL